MQRRQAAAQELVLAIRVVADRRGQERRQPSRPGHQRGAGIEQLIGPAPQPSSRKLTFTPVATQVGSQKNKSDVAQANIDKDAEHSLESNHLNYSK